MLVVRSETPNDYAAVAALTRAAFGKPREARLVEALRASEGFVPELALVAELDGEVVGHILLTYVSLEGGARLLELGPMSVRPDRQREGIGASLIRAAVGQADVRGEPLVLVLGHAAYYPRFGFRRASELNIAPPDPQIPDEAWMAIPLTATTPLCQVRWSCPTRGRFPSRCPPHPGVIPEHWPGESAPIR